MRIAAFTKRGGYLVLVASVLLFGFFTGVAAAASPVTYTLSPSGGNYRPGASVGLQLTIKTTVAIAGASVRVGYTNASFAALTSAGTPQFTFVDYNQTQRDVIAICANNNCPPGTYTIGTLFVTAGQPGAMEISLTPQETADPNLQKLSADPYKASYVVNASAPATPASTSKPRSTFTVPRNNTGTTMVPQQLSQEQYDDQQQYAYLPNNDGYNPVIDYSPIATSTRGAKKTGLSPLIYVLLGLSLGLLSVLALLLAFRKRGQAAAYSLDSDLYSVPAASTEQPVTVIRPDQNKQ